MSQRITISYSIELAELETEVQRLISKSLTAMEECLVDFRENMSECNSLEMRQHEVIDQLRQDLSDIDFSLSDINAIINTYNTYRIQQAVPNAPTPEHSPDMNQIQETLKNLRSVVSESHEVTD